MNSVYSILPEPSRSISRIINYNRSPSPIRSFMMLLNYYKEIVPSALVSARLKISYRPTFYEFVSSCETV